MFLKVPSPRVSCARCAKVLTPYGWEEPGVPNSARAGPRGGRGRRRIDRVVSRYGEQVLRYGPKALKSKLETQNQKKSERFLHHFFINFKIWYTKLEYFNFPEKLKMSKYIFFNIATFLFKQRIKQYY